MFSLKVKVDLTFLLKQSGAQAGTVIALPLSGVLARELGWEWVFYASGILGLIWFVFWALLIHDGPDVHPYINEV